MAEAALRAVVGGTTIEFWTAEAVEMRLAEAASTLRKLEGDGPRGDKAFWPAEVLHDFWQMWNGLSDRERLERVRDFNRVRVLATAKQIRRLDEVLGWLYSDELMSPRTRGMLWGRAQGDSWRRIAMYVGRDPKTIRTVDYPRAIERLVARLNKIPH